MQFKERHWSPTRGLLLALARRSPPSPPGAATDETDDAVEHDGAGRGQRRPVAGPADDLAMAALHRSRARTGRSPSSRRTPASTSSTSRTSTTTTSSSAKLQPQLAEGDSGGRSLITVSDWLAAQMYDLGYLQHLDYAQLPNVKKQPDPGAAPSGGRPEARLHGSLAERDDRPDRPHGPGARTSTRSATCSTPSTRARSTMLTEMRDTVPMTLKCMGIDPDTATTDQWLAAVDKIKAAADSGQIRKLHRQRLHPRPARRATPGLRARLVGRRGPAPEGQPEHRVRDAEGGLHALVDEHGDPGRRPEPGRPPQALMNYVYDPKVQADIAEWVNYVTPVKGVKAILAQARPRAGEEPADLPERELHGELHASSRCSAAQLGEDVTKAFERRDHRLSRCGRSRSRRCRPRPSPGDPGRDARPPRRARRARSGAVVPTSQLVLLPELHLSAPPAPLEERRLRRRRSRWRSPARSPSALGEIAARARRLARRRARSTSAATDGRIHNTAPGPRPRRASSSPRYRKVFPWQPHEACAPGDGFVTFDIPEVGRIGLADLLRRQLPRDLPPARLDGRRGRAPARA